MGIYHKTGNKLLCNTSIAMMPSRFVFTEIFKHFHGYLEMHVSHHGDT